MDEALLSITPAGCGQLVNLIITLEQNGIFGSNFSYLFPSAFFISFTKGKIGSTGVSASVTQFSRPIFNLFFINYVLRKKEETMTCFISKLANFSTIRLQYFAKAY